MIRLTEDAVERGARALAEALNGGAWDTNYAPGQKTLWRARVIKALEHAPADGTKEKSE